MNNVELKEVQKSFRNLLQNNILSTNYKTFKK